MPERIGKISPETFKWLQERYEQDVLLLVNNPDSFCGSEIREKMDHEIREYYEVLKSVGNDINFGFWDVIKKHLDCTNAKHKERVNLFTRIVFEESYDDAVKS